MPSAVPLRTNQTAASGLVSAGQLIVARARRGSQPHNRTSKRAAATGERSEEAVEIRSGTNRVREGTAGWRCTTCGGLITRIEHGWWNGSPRRIHEEPPP